MFLLDAGATDYNHHITTIPPRFLDGAASLLMMRRKQNMVSDEAWFKKRQDFYEWRKYFALVTKILSMLAAPLYISFYSFALESGVET